MTTSPDDALPLDGKLTAHLRAAKRPAGQDLVARAKVAQGAGIHITRTAIRELIRAIDADKLALVAEIAEGNYHAGRRAQLRDLATTGEGPDTLRRLRAEITADSIATAALASAAMGILQRIANGTELSIEGDAAVALQAALDRVH